MSASRFVCGSSVIIAGWLGATFLSDVPAKGYPKLDKKPATAFLNSSRPTGFTDADLKAAFPQAIIR